MRRLLAIAILLCLPASADAGVKIDRAKAIASSYWGNPCPSGVSFYWTDWRKVSDEPISAWARPERCAIHFNRERKMAFPTFCTIVLHEYGHLAGYRNEANVDEPWHDPEHAGTIMAPAFSGDIVVHRNSRHEYVLADDDIDIRCRLRLRK
jgi:hypothetical protein